MGLYSTIQSKLGAAVEGPLADAFRIVQFIVVTNVYDGINMINTTTETATDILCSVQSEFEGDQIDETTLMNSVKIIILDSERNSVTFAIDMKIQDGTNTYIIKGFNTDPAGASWTVYARRLG